MAKEIKYTTSEQQIEQLKQKGLLFDNVQEAQNSLNRYGYYNIMNSYKGTYQTLENGKRVYLENTTFEQIFSMFTLDHSLRNSIMASMLDLEECLRAAVAEIIARNFGIDHNVYLNYNNYRDRVSSNPKFSLKGVLSTLHNNVYSGKDPIRYYREQYGVIPPWILLKGTYFSTLINFIKCFKHKQKQQLLSILLSNFASQDITPEIISLFQTTLFICLDYRNAAAHGGRIYNFHSNYTDNLSITSNLITLFPQLKDVKNLSGIHQLMSLLDIFKYKQPLHIIADSLNEQVNRHLHRYPNDINLLSQHIGVPIEKQLFVWVNEKTKKYHYINTCSGLANAQQLPLSAEIIANYSPCKRCTTSFSL